MARLAHTTRSIHEYVDGSTNICDVTETSLRRCQQNLIALCVTTTNYETISALAPVRTKTQKERLVFYESNPAPVFRSPDADGIFSRSLGTNFGCGPDPAEEEA